VFKFLPILPGGKEDTDAGAAPGFLPILLIGNEDTTAGDGPGNGFRPILLGGYMDNEDVGPDDDSDGGLTARKLIV